MMKILSVLLFVLMNMPALAQHSVDWWVIGSGYTFAEDGTYRLTSTIGQAVIEPVENQSYVFSQGFWYPGLLPVGVPENYFGSSNGSLNVFPNPFSDRINIYFNNSIPSSVKLSIYNMRGEFLDVLFDGSSLTASGNITWNGKINGVESPSGFYILELSLKSDATSSILKSMIIKSK